MCTMSTLTIRTDVEVEKALTALTGDGRTRSDVVRAAILDAERQHRRALVRAESAALMEDPEEVAASKALLAEMDSVRAW